MGSSQAVLTDLLPVVAWRVEINAMSCIVFATTAPKAKYIAVRAYWDAYGRNGWPRPTVGRAKEYDDSALRMGRQTAWTEDHVRNSERISAKEVRGG